MRFSSADNLLKDWQAALAQDQITSPHIGKEPSAAPKFEVYSFRAFRRGLGDLPQIANSVVGLHLEKRSDASAQVVTIGMLVAKENTASLYDGFDVFGNVKLTEDFSFVLQYRRHKHFRAFRVKYELDRLGDR